MKPPNCKVPVTVSRDRSNRPAASSCLTAQLAERVLGWKFANGRFLTGNRSWKPSWYFQPERNLCDALRLLEAARSRATPSEAAKDVPAGAMSRSTGTLGRRAIRLCREQLVSLWRERCESKKGGAIEFEGPIHP